MSWNVWNRPSGSFMVDMGISSNIMKSPSPKCYMTFWDMTIYNDILNWSDITHIFHLEYPLVLSRFYLLPNWTLIPILTLLPNFEGFHRTLQRVRLANRGRLLLRTPGPVPFRTCICSNVETILSWTCHVYGPFEFRTSLGTSILLLIPMRKAPTQSEKSQKQRDNTKTRKNDQEEKRHPTNWCG